MAVLTVCSLHITSEEGEGRADGDESVVEMRRRQWYRLRRERGWHIWVHTHEHCESRSGSCVGAPGHRTLHTSLSTAWPEHGGLARPSGPWVTQPAGARESQERPMDGGADVAAWRAGVAGSGEGCHCGRRVGTLRQCPHSPPGSRCPSHRGQTSVRPRHILTSPGRDTDQPPEQGRREARGGDNPSLVSVVAKLKANVFEWSQIEAGWSLNRFIMVIRNSNQSNTIIKLT